VAHDFAGRHLTSEQIQEFLDERLTPPESAQVREHLSACPRCQGELEAWEVLFSELGELPELAPGPGFSRPILENLPVKEPVGARVRSWIGSLVPGRSGQGHLLPESIQDYVEGALSRRRAARAESHLAACRTCREEAREWHEVFGALGSLERFEPSTGFSQAVMSRVRVPAPVPAKGVAALGGRALDWIRGLLPRTRKGWAVAGGIASAPTITMVALVYLVFSHPLLTLGNLFHYVSWKASAFFASAFTAVAGRLVESVAVFKAYALLEAVTASPLLVGAGGLGFTFLCALALWVLYRNLITTPSVDDRYARVRI
jgi:anti-sigma factor RsiW